jgi:serine/threonine-protein kinase RsbW
MKYVCEKQFKSDLKTAQHVINEILSNIDSKIDEDIYFDVRLILNELVSNCVLHGNKKDEAKQINLFFSFNGKKIKIVVSDEGKGIKLLKKCNPNHFEENGRGLIIVKGLSDKLHINGNTVTVQKSIS